MEYVWGFHFSKDADGLMDCDIKHSLVEGYQNLGETYGHHRYLHSGHRGDTFILNVANNLQNDRPSQSRTTQ